MQPIGERLREARMRQGRDLSEVEVATKIRAKYLRALENDEFSMLPGGTFVKSFLRTYAEYLGLDAQLLVEEYRAQHEPRGEGEMQSFAPSSPARPGLERRASDVPRQAPAHQPRAQLRRPLPERQAGALPPEPLVRGPLVLHAKHSRRSAAGRPEALRLSARAGIVVTGTEVLTGRVKDRNGPWLADRLLELGIELAHITLCGDRPEDMRAQLRFMADQGMDLLVTSGGLGPTADDLTMESVARFAGRELVLDPRLEARIAEILKPLMQRWRDPDPDAILASNRNTELTHAGA